MNFQPKRLCHQILREFIDHRQFVFAFHGKAQAAAVLFEDRIQFFNDDQAVHRSRKIFDQFFRKRIYQPQLQDGGFVSENLFRILIGGGRGNDADLAAAAFDPVEIGRFGEGAKGFCAFFYDGMTPFGHARHHDVLSNVFLICLFRHHALARFHNRLGVGDAGAHLDDYRRVIFFGKLIGFFDKSQGFSGI